MGEGTNSFIHFIKILIFTEIDKGVVSAVETVIDECIPWNQTAVGCRAGCFAFSGLIRNKHFEVLFVLDGVDHNELTLLQESNCKILNK